MDRRKTIEVYVDEEKQRVVVDINGPIFDQSQHQVELTALRELSSEHNSVIVFINSPGGNLSSTVAMLSYLRLYSQIITVGVGEVCSAGLILWSIGDVRVSAPYTLFMAHRESYGPGVLKTMEHSHKASKIDNICDKLAAETFNILLTDEEIEKCKLTEVYLSHDDIIKRKQAITFEDFMMIDNKPYNAVMMLEIDSVMYQPTDKGTLIDKKGKEHNSNKIRYKLPY